MNLLPHALAAHEAGMSVVPVATDGTKTPAVAWKKYQDERASIEQLHAWFGPHGAYGVVCGRVSGNLEMLELEGRAVNEGLIERFAQLLIDHGYNDLWTRLTSGHVEVTPSGGFHWYYRVDGTPRGNLKLASRPATPDELTQNPHDTVKVLVETRGEGGFTVLAPSTGHHTGKDWLRIVHGLVPVISVDERDALHALARMLDQQPEVTPGPKAAQHASSPADGRPGDDFNARADWADILIPHGWTEARGIAGCRSWRRPGKTDPGISATTGHTDNDTLKVFSTSTPFDTAGTYSKFGAYALLEHGNDWAAAARDLRSKGYGKPLEPQRPVSPMTGLPVTDGNLATVHELRPQQTAHVNEQTLEHSDDGNALLLVETFGDRIRYCPQRGQWLTWDGLRWQWCQSGGGKVREYAKQIARSLPDNDRAQASHKKRSLGAVGTTAMLTQAHTDPRISVHVDQLDAHPWELNTPGGIVDLRTGQLRPPDPARMHTRITSCAPDPDSDPSRWTQFLKDTFGGDTPLIAYLRRLVGYSSVGLVGPHVLPFCFGSGGNGKGVFLESLTRVLGDYATTTPGGFLMKQAHAQHETEIARLAGARMVLCSEVNEDDQFDEAKVKQLTGGDSLTARFMRQDHFTFTPTHQLWLMGNHRPAVRSGGRAFWRRLRLIGFEHEVPSEKVVDDLQVLLATEHGPALLAWIVQGAAEYHQHGLLEPASVKSATDEYARDQDTVARFLDDSCDLHGNQQVKVKVTLVREAYEAWCREAGEPPVSAKAFGMAVQRRGVEAVKGNKGQRFYAGMTLLRATSDGEEDTSWAS